MHCRRTYITSIVVRHFHRVLADRLGEIPRLLSEEQRAFRIRVDGVAENLCALEALLWEVRSSIKSLHVNLCSSTRVEMQKTLDNLYRDWSDAG